MEAVNIGRRLFYDKVTGIVILDTGEKLGYVTPTTVDEDIKMYPELSSKDRDSIAYIELDYGAHRDLFEKSNRIIINPETLEMEFFTVFNPADVIKRMRYSQEERLENIEKVLAKLLANATPTQDEVLDIIKQDFINKKVKDIRHSSNQVKGSYQVHKEPFSALYAFAKSLDGIEQDNVWAK